MGTFGSRGGLHLQAPLKRPSCPSHEEAQIKTEQAGLLKKVSLIDESPVSQAVGLAIQHAKEKSRSK